MLLVCEPIWNLDLFLVCRGRTRSEVMQAIKLKESAVKRLVNKFASDSISEEEIEWCLYSIGKIAPLYQVCGFEFAWIRIIFRSWIWIRIRVKKSLIRIRNPTLYTQKIFMYFSYFLKKFIAICLLYGRLAIWDLGFLNNFYKGGKYSEISDIKGRAPRSGYL